jgi:hypothetical protein
MTLWDEWPSNESWNFFAESLAAFWIGQGFEELLTAEALHLAERFLDSAPISNRLLKPLVLLLGQGDANGLSFDFACPRITSAPGSRSPILNIAFANPPSVGQLSSESGVFLLAEKGSGHFLWRHNEKSSMSVNR